MNKNVRVSIFIALCCINITNIKSQSYLQSIQNIQNIISACLQSPVMTIMLFLFIYYKKLCLINKHKNDILSHSQILKPYTITPEYNLEDSDCTFVLSSDGQKNPYYNVHHCEISPKNNYLLICYLEEIPILDIIFEVILKKVGIRRTTHNLFDFFSITNLIDVQTGKIIQSFENAQCTFGHDENILLIREQKPISKIKELLIFLQIIKKNPSNTKEDISFTQYKLFDISTKKYIKPFLTDIRSANFYKKKYLKIIDLEGKVKYLQRTQNFSFINKINPFASNIQYTEIKNPKTPSNTNIGYYFDNIKKTYCLNISSRRKPIENVRTYQVNGNYLLVNIDGNKRKKNDSILNQFRTIILEDTAPQLVTKLINLTTGEFVSAFNYKNPVMCSFIPNQNSILIIEFDEEKQSFVYQRFNLSKSTVDIFESAQAITFNINNPYKIIDGNNNECETSEKSIFLKEMKNEAQDTFNKIEDTVEELAAGAHNFFNNIMNTIESKNANNNVDIGTNQQPAHSIEENTKYQNFSFGCKKPSTCPKTKTDYVSLLQNNIHSFKWNIYLFTRDKFSNPAFNGLDEYPFAPWGHICISNLSPKEMKYNQYQSLTKEITQVLSYMKQNKNAVISIFLTQNDCPTEKINAEISEKLKSEKYDPLLKPADLQAQNISLSDLTLSQMIQQNKRLLFFCNEKETEITFPLSAASKNIEYI